MILLWGVLEDTPLSMVHDELRERGAPLLFLDQHQVLSTELEIHVDSKAHASLRIDEEEFDLDAITGAYVRPHEVRHLPHVSAAGEGSAAWQYVLALDEALAGWLELTDALVINRPSAMASNNSKPLQAMQIRSFGFEVPDTLITTDVDVAKAFWAEHGTVIYKSISGVRSIVARLGERHLDRMDDLAWCPTQFQQYIPGDDYRVHVVGDHIFACRIQSEADDYRYAGRHDVPVFVEACELPPPCTERCHSLASSMGLALAGIDLRLTPDGRWFCFEVNPSPAFSYYQDITEQPIAAAVARLLMQGKGPLNSSLRAVPAVAPA